jgi:hypothetical protein
MIDIYLDKQVGYQLGKWGGAFSATQVACHLICNGKSLSPEQAQATIAQLQSHKKYIWDNIERLEHPQCGNDIRELNQLIEALENAMMVASDI